MPRSGPQELKKKAHLVDLDEQLSHFTGSVSDLSRILWCLGDAFMESRRGY